MELITSVDTWLKPSAQDSSKLDEKDMALVGARQEFPVLAYRQESGHIVFTIDPNNYDLFGLHPSGKNTWWVWQGAVTDPEGFGPDNNPSDTPASPGDGTPFTLPGYTQTFFSRSAISGRSPHFTWAEALHFAGGGYRRPVDANTVNRVMSAAIAMEEIRKRLGDRAITITSWYRDPVTNRRVGGATRSRHMMGDGVDFAVAGMSPPQVFAALDGWWGNRGGLAHGLGFTHIDCRGYRARWRYPGA